MERFRPLNRGPRLCFGLLLAGLLTGCAGTRSDLKALLDKKPNLHTVASTPAPAVVQQVVHSKPSDKNAPAAEFACGWQTRLAQLPDPTKNGSMTAGLVGQVFLFTSEVKPAEVNGDLTVMVSDATLRPTGMPVAKSEVWHFSAEILRKMVVDDERFGRSVVVFLPWPPEWHDVNRLNIQARFDQPGTHTLYAQPTTVTIDFSGNGPGQPAIMPGVPTAMNAIPDPKLMLQQNRTPVLPAMAPMMANRPMPQQGAMPQADRMVQSPLPGPPSFANVPVMPAAAPPPPTMIARPQLPPVIDSNLGPMKVEQVGYNGYGIPQLQPAGGARPSLPVGVQQPGGGAPEPASYPPPQMPKNSDGTRFVIPRPQ